MESIVRKIQSLAREFPGLQEAIDLTIEQARYVKKVTAINVKRVDGSLLHRVLLRSLVHEVVGQLKLWRNQELWVLREGDAVCVDIRKYTSVSTIGPSENLHASEDGEIVSRRLAGHERIDYLVLTDEVYDPGEGVFELKVTVYKPAKGSSIAVDVAEEAAWQQWQDELERERQLSGYYDADDEEEWPQEYTEIDLSDPGTGGLVIFE